MKLLDKKYASNLKQATCWIIEATDDVACNFCRWKINNPDANTTDIERNIPDAIWELLKAAQAILGAEAKLAELQLVLDDEKGGCHHEVPHLRQSV